MRTWTRSMETACRACFSGEARSGYIGSDGKRHDFVFDPSDYRWHTFMPVWEYYIMNDPGQLEACSRCAMWVRCRDVEYTLITREALERKAADEVAAGISKEIMESVLDSQDVDRQ